jgi:hypothetical protein
MRFSQPEAHLDTVATAGGRAHHSVRVAEHAKTAQTRPAFGIHGADGVTRPTLAGDPMAAARSKSN